MLKLIKTEDGSHTVHSEKFGVAYHSIYGAVQETKTVFLNAGLEYKASTQTNLSILEIGFGTGLNAFMTYLTAKEKTYTIKYVGVEAYPIGKELALQLNYPECLNAVDETSILEAMHEKANEWIHLSKDFVFMQEIKKFHALDYANAFDVIYYDAFSPNVQPELWDKAILEKMYTVLKAQGVLVTYCAKGAFKRTLSSLGFEVAALPGPKNKREMTRAIKPS